MTPDSDPSPDIAGDNRKRARLPGVPRVTLTVSQELIDRAVPKDSGHCMLADAVKASVPTATHIAVDLQTIRFSDPVRKLRYIYLTPRAAQKALVHFDQGNRALLEPFSVQLRTGQTVRMKRLTPSDKERLRKYPSSKRAKLQGRGGECRPQQDRRADATAK